MKTEAKQTARDRILDSASRLFYAHGIRAVGIDRIIAESGVAKATLYKHFPAKDDLVVAYLDQVDREWKGELRAAAAAGGSMPAEQLVALFDALAVACQRDWYRGCGFINAAAEYEVGTRTHERVVQHKDDVRAWLRELAHDAGATDPDGLARALSLLIDGALASGSVDARPDAPQAAKRSARVLIKAATP